jgi:hypothetical protein
VQGRQQTVFEEQAKVMAETRRRILAADKALFFASTYTDKELGARLQDELLDKVGSLGDYHQEQSVWLDERLNAKIARIVGGYWAVTTTRPERWSRDTTVSRPLPISGAWSQRRSTRKSGSGIGTKDKLSLRTWKPKPEIRSSDIVGLAMRRVLYS